jgi:glycolate oxidase iron-sulfur subunit
MSQDSSTTEIPYERFLDCVHCGLCTAACPTYAELGNENDGPRGRIYLMRGVAEGKIGLSSAVADELHLCLGCRACESACPSGVEYGAMLERGRAAVRDAGLRSGLAARLEQLALQHVIPHPRRLHAVVSLLGWVQRLGLDRLVLPLLPAALSARHSLLPAVPAIEARRRLPPLSRAIGERRGRVAVLEGCVMPELFGAVNRATVDVLRHNGYDVVVPQDQVCCGALHVHSGDFDNACKLARRNLAAFDAPGGEAPDAIVINSAGCGAAMREVEGWLGDGAAGFGAPVVDICEFLDAEGLRPPSRPVAARVCYDDPCHLLHGQGVEAAPRRLLQQIEGLVLVPHADAGACCGAAGTYNLTQPEMSAQILATKLDALTAASPDVVASGNPGCMLQLASGVAQRGLAMRVVHPVTLLAEAYGIDTA